MTEGGNAYIMKDMSEGGLHDNMRGTAYVKQNGKYGFIDKRGKYLINPAYDYVRMFSNGVAQIFVKATKNRFGMKCGFGLMKDPDVLIGTGK